MILRFMTKRNTNGNRKYFALDTEKRVFCTYCRYMIPDAAEVTARTLATIRAAAENDGYKETEAF